MSACKYVYVTKCVYVSKCVCVCETMSVFMYKCECLDTRQCVRECIFQL